MQNKIFKQFFALLASILLIVSYFPNHISFAMSELQEGMEGPQVKELQENLDKLGFKVVDEPTEFYGEQTAKQIEAFQNYYNLEASGDANQETLNLIEQILSESLQNGKSNEDVIQLKKDLTTIGYLFPEEPSEVFGDVTEAQISLFQKDTALIENGLLDPVTEKEIERQLELVENDDKDAVEPSEPVEEPVDDLSLDGEDSEDELDEEDNSDLDHEQSTEEETNDSSEEAKPDAESSESEIEADENADKDEENEEEASEPKPQIQTFAAMPAAAPAYLAKGMKHKDVVKLKKDLAKAGFKVPGKGTTLFGKDTETKVKEFQRYYRLDVDGIVGSGTQQQIKKVINSPLQNGKKHKDTKKLKKDLAKVGFKVPGNGTTLFGVQTQKQVKAFQKKYKLVQNGIADEVTLLRLKTLVETSTNPTLSDGERHSAVVKLKKDLAKAGFKVPGNGTTLFGSQTKKKVIEFQKYYGLGADGIVGRATQNKLSEVINSPFQNGKRHADTPQLKKDLAKAGFKVPGNGTTLYGKQTAAKVKAFQKKYKLVQNGIVDSKTQSKLNSLYHPVLMDGKRHNDVIQLKKDLAKVGFKVPGNGTTLYGKQTATKVKAFQKYYGLDDDGIAGNATKTMLKSVVNSPLQNGKKHTNTKKLKNDLAKAGFKVPGNGTTLYGKQTTVKVKAFQKKYKLIQNGIADSVTLAKLAEVISTKLSTNYNLTLNKALDIQLKTAPQTDRAFGWVIKSSVKNNKATKATEVRSLPSTGKINGFTSNKLGTVKKNSTVKIIDEYNGWYAINHSSRANKHAYPKDVKSYLDPNKHSSLQHLRLDKTAGVSVKQLNDVLHGMGILSGTGHAFISAGKQYNLNEAYLIAHALHETGNGNSQLAKGVKYKGKTVYNMYGIGAVDSNPLNGGAKTAYENGWFTPEAAIIGGAKWINGDYINNKYKQNTLYKMKWNPDMANGSVWKQYATDIGWAVKQTTKIQNIYAQLNSPRYNYDYPKYK